MLFLLVLSICVVVVVVLVVLVYVLVDLVLLLLLQEAVAWEKEACMQLPPLLPLLPLLPPSPPLDQIPPHITATSTTPHRKNQGNREILLFAYFKCRSKFRFRVENYLFKENRIQSMLKSFHNHSCHFRIHHWPLMVQFSCRVGMVD